MQPPDGPFRVEVLLPERTAVLSGELDMAYTKALADAVAPLVAQPGDVIVDLRALSFIDSSGLLALLRTADLVTNGNLVLRKPSESVRRVLDLVELADVSPRIVIDD
jgi:anti-anti-sigma factor